MYISTRRPQGLPTAKQLGQTDATPDYVSQIKNFQTLANNKNWQSLSDGITTLLGDSNLVNSATLIDPLKVLQIGVNKALSGSNVANDIQASLDNLLLQAQTEASASQEDRLINQQLLIQRIYNLNSEVSSIIGSNTGIKAIWTKLSGKEASVFTPLRADLQNIADDLKTTPLTINGKNSLTKQFAVIQTTIDNAWTVASGSAFQFAVPILITALGTAAIAWAWTWSAAKAKEHAVKHITKLHKKYIKKEPIHEGLKKKRKR